MSFLLDTDTCSAYMKGNFLIFNRFMQYTGRLHMSAVTLGELTIWRPARAQGSMRQGAGAKSTRGLGAHSC